MRATAISLNCILLPEIHAQHRRSEAISHRSLFVLYALLSLVGWRPQLLPVRIVFVMQIALALAIIRSVDGLSIRATLVGPAAVGKIRPENEELA